MAELELKALEAKRQNLEHQQQAFDLWVRDDTAKMSIDNSTEPAEQSHTATSTLKHDKKQVKARYGGTHFVFRTIDWERTGKRRRETRETEAEKDPEHAVCRMSHGDNMREWWENTTIVSPIIMMDTATASNNSGSDALCIGGCWTR